MLFELYLHRMMKRNKKINNKYCTISIPEYFCWGNENTDSFSNRGIYQKSVRHPYLHTQLIQLP